MKLKDIFYYIQGNIRYCVFYSDFTYFLLKHIREQIEFRIASMNSECYSSGQCKKCGCSTTALQMCNKACDGNCYPRMLNYREWQNIKQGYIFQEENTELLWVLGTTKFEKV